MKTCNIPPFEKKGRSDVFSSILWNFKNISFERTSSNDCFYVYAWPQVHKGFIEYRKLFLIFKFTIKKFLVFQEMELSSSKIKKILIFQKWNFLALKLKNFLYFGKWNLLASNSKSSYISGGNLQSLKIQNCNFFFVEREQVQKEKVSYTFLYKEVKFSKFKYILIIIIKRFFSFYNSFSYTQPVYFFILWEILC